MAVSVTIIAVFAMVAVIVVVVVVVEGLAWAEAIIDIGVEVLTDVSVNAFAVVITALEFPVSTPLEEFSR